MSWNIQSLKVLHTQYLSSDIDLLLFKEVFTRRGASTFYRRKLEYAKQELNLYTRLSHPDDGDCAHITGVILITMTEINQLLASLTNSNESLMAFAGGITLEMPIGFLGPEHSYQEWRATNAEEYKGSMTEVADFIDTYTLPFLREYINPRALISTTDQHDRLLMPEGGGLTVAAAYLLEGRKDEARAVVESRYGSKPGTRRRYQSAFDYLDSQSAAPLRVVNGSECH